MPVIWHQTIAGDTHVGTGMCLSQRAYRRTAVVPRAGSERDRRDFRSKAWTARHRELFDDTVERRARRESRSILDPFLSVGWFWGSNV